jgi:TetR/AcrR family transcriptional regulator, repressor of fatR-cypB operon
MARKSLPFFLSETDPPAKQAILTSALDLFATRGVDGVTIRDIAAETGFTNPAMFRHFKNKEELAQSLFEVCYRRLAHGFLQPGATLESVLERGLALVEESPESVHFVVENLRRYWRALPAEIRAHSLLGSMRRLIEAEQRAGKVRADADPNLAAALVLGALSQIARMAHFKELSKPPGALTDDLLNLINRGLGA